MIGNLYAHKFSLWNSTIYYCIQKLIYMNKVYNIVFFIMFCSYRYLSWRNIAEHSGTIIIFHLKFVFFTVLKVKSSLNSFRLPCM